MQEFIQSVAQKFGIDDAAAGKAATALLGFVKDKLGDTDFSQLLGKLPGAEQLMSAAGDSGGEAEGGGGGLLGGVMKMASSALGGDAGSALDLTSKLSDAGLSLDQLGSFGTMFVDFVKDKAGEDVVNQLLDKLPDLKKMLG